MALRDTAPLLVGLLLFFHTLGVWATVEVNMEDKVEVFAEETARITCMFATDEGPGGTTIQWFYVPLFGEKQRIYNKEPMQEAAETSTPFKDRISLNVNGTTAVLIIRKVGVKDEVEFICVIKTLTDGTGEGRTKLKVFVLPDLPSIEGVQTGISVNEEEPSKIGSCEVKNGYPKPNITWYRNNMPLRNTPKQLDVLTTVTTESSSLVSVTSELKMKVKKEDKDAKFYCEVVYFVPGATRMTESRRINITVYYLPTAVDIWVESPKGKIKEGDTLELRCKDNGNYPSSITTIKRSDQSTTEPVDSVEDTIMKRSKVTRSDSGVYECTFEDTDSFEQISGSTEVFVNYLDPAVITPKDSVVVMEGEELKASCNALSSLRTATTWFKNEKVFSKENILVMKNATFDTAGMYMCVVTVPEIEGMKTSGTLRVNVKGPPKIVGPDIQEVETYESTVNLSCSFRGFPVPTIIWTTADGKILKALQTMTEDATQSVVTVNVISSVTAFCNASNDLGTKVAVFNIKAIINTTLTTTITITPSTNTTFLNDTVINTTLTTTITITPSTNTTFLNDTVIHTTPTSTTTFFNETVINTTSSSITPANITTTPSSNTTFFNDTVTHTTSATKTTLSNDTVKTPTKSPNIKKESKGFVIAVIIICILLLAVLGSVLYFLYKKGRICGRSGKQDLTKGKSSKDNIVVEMKSDNTEEAVLLGVNGEKQPPNDQ